MKNIMKFSKIVLLIGLVLMLSTCKKNKFLNVNQNPNYPANAPVGLVLPTCEANIGYMVGNTLSIYGGLWAQYWTQDGSYGSQYGTFDSYVNFPTDNDNLWQALYTTGASLNFIISNVDSTQKNYAAIAYFLKAYDFQLLCDAFGDIPVAQALKGAANVAPPFDPGMQVYDSMVVWINAGMKLVDLTQNAPNEDLVFPGQPMNYWQQFANTLLLKIYIRECRVAPSVASSGIKKLVTQMSTNGTSFMSVPKADDAKLIYVSTIYQQFPLYATGLSLGYRTLTGSATCISYMNMLNDPRVVDFYSPNVSSGAYQGSPQGDWKAYAILPDTGFSPPGPEVLSATASNRFMTASESYFLQAEAVQRGYMTGSAGALYNAGITASWNSWTNSSANIGNIGAYLNSDSVNYSKAAGLDAKVRLIMIQKWLSMCGNQNFEAWTEWRRVGYPNFFTVSLSSVLGTTQMPRRLVYPSAEINDNHSFPGLQSITAPVWWDINP